MDKKLYSMKFKMHLISFIVVMYILLISFSTKNSTDFLYMYGKHIYERENCNRCHTLYQTDDKNIISLDGLKGKYFISWHFWHLVNPQTLVFDSKMPSYSFLMNSNFTKDSINNTISISDEDWQHELDKAKKIKQELGNEDIKINENSEIIALLYFLDNIAESEQLKLIREKEMSRLLEEQKIMDSLWLNAERTINNIPIDKKNIAKGKELFQSNCTACHGKSGEGVVGPNLTDSYWLHGGSIVNIANTIANGIPEKGMIACRFKFTPNEVGQLVVYIKSLKKSNSPNAKDKQGIRE